MRRLFTITLSLIAAITVSAQVSDKAKALMAKAEAGDVFAQNDLGMLYNNGTEGLPKDKAKALAWFKKAAAQGLFRSIENVADVYFTSGNKAEAAKWYQILADNYYCHAMFNIANFTHVGTAGFTKDPYRAFKLYHEAALAGSGNAQNNLGDAYKDGKGTDVNKQEAFKWYYIGAMKGNKFAEYNLAVCYWEGIGCKVDYVGALEFYTKASNHGFEPGQQEMAQLAAEIMIDADRNNSNAQYAAYYMLKDIPGMEKEAMKYYAKAMKAMNPTAYYYEAYRSYLKETSEDTKEAARMYKIAADGGNDGAQINLGLMYATGKGVQKDEVEAVRLYKMAADQGIPEGAFNLGMMYYDGRGTAKDDRKAFEYLKIAADACMTNAWYFIATMLEEGRVNENLIVKHLGSKTAEEYAAQYYLYASWNAMPQAQAKIAECYYYGKGVAQSYVRAAEFADACIKSKVPMGSAMTLLSKIYRNGRGGVLKDETKADRLLQEAARKNDDAAIRALKAVNSL